MKYALSSPISKSTTLQFYTAKMRRMSEEVLRRLVGEEIVCMMGLAVESGRVGSGGEMGEPCRVVEL